RTLTGRAPTPSGSPWTVGRASLSSKGAWPVGGRPVPGRGGVGWAAVARLPVARAAARRGETGGRHQPNGVGQPFAGIPFGGTVPSVPLYAVTAPDPSSVVYAGPNATALPPVIFASCTPV